MSSAVASQLCDRLGVAPRTVQSLHGGCVGDVYRVTFPPENPWGVAQAVVKLGESPSARLDLEGLMLQYLATHSTLPVPEVFHAEATLLVMSWLPGKSQFSAQARAHAAQLLAQLHQVTAPLFGFEQDTLIGSLLQPNPWTSQWVPFFRDQRLLYMTHQAHQEGILPTGMLSRLETFSAHLDTWLQEPDHPALLHGDVWTTNVLATGNRITGFLDPAVYYGHPEIELAFTTLFGTFDEPFFKRYDEISPIAPGFFEIRRDIYNLYPRLVHVRLFGTSYLSGIDRTLKHLGF